MIWLYIVLGIVGAFIIFAFLPCLLVGYIIYRILFVKTSPEKWSRSVSWDDAELQQMFDEGKKWGEENDKYRKTLSITNDKLKLVAEFFDFGFDRSVIIIPGRMESGTYSYYFSNAYKEAGFNVLAIDNRGHGLSEGKYNTLGLKEYKDLLAWSKYIHDECGQKKIIFHGLCIGSAAGLYASIDKNTPEYIGGLIAEGMYINFNESLNNHLIERHKPIFPFSQFIMFFMTLSAGGKSPKKYGPINLIDKMDKPMLFIYSKEDTYSVPKYGQLLFDKCGSDKKRLVWFDHGVHSHVRIHAPEKYDETIKEFIRDYIDE